MAKHKIDINSLEVELNKLLKRNQFKTALEFVNEKLELCEEKDKISKMYILALQGRSYFLKSEYIKNKCLSKKLRVPKQIQLEIVELIKNAEEAFSKSETFAGSSGTRNNSELKSKACLLYNKGIFLMKTNKIDEGLECIMEAIETFKKLQLKNKLCDALFFLSNTLNESKYLDDILSLKSTSLEARFLAVKKKGLMLMKCGKWNEAKNFLLAEKESWLHKEDIAKYLKAAILMAALEEKLSHTNNEPELMALNEIGGDIAVKIKLFDQSIHFYKKMLEYAKKFGNKKKISEANVSVYETLLDCKKYSEALPYAKSELEYIKEGNDSTEIARMFLCYGYVLQGAGNDIGEDIEEITEVNNTALIHAKRANNPELQLKIIRVSICNIINFGIGDPTTLISLNKQKKELKKLLNQDEYETDDDDINSEDDDFSNDADSEPEDILKYINNLSKDDLKLEALEGIKYIFEEHQLGKKTEIAKLKKDIKKIKDKLRKNLNASKTVAPEEQSSGNSHQQDDIIDLTHLEYDEDREMPSIRKSPVISKQLNKRRKIRKHKAQAVCNDNDAQQETDTARESMEVSGENDSLNVNIEEIINHDKDIEKLYRSLLNELKRKTGKDFEIVTKNETNSANRKRCLSSSSTSGQVSAKQRKTIYQSPSSTSSTQCFHIPTSESSNADILMDNSNTSQIIKQLTERLTVLEKLLIVPNQESVQKNRENADGDVECEFEAHEEKLKFTK